MMGSLLCRQLRLAVCVLALLLAATGALAQGADEELSDILEGVGTAEAVEDDAPGTGSIYGRIYDGETGAPLSGASVILTWPDPGDGSEARQEVAVTEIDGSYEFASVPPGLYELTFIKAGYRASTMTGFEVTEDGDNVADFPLPAIPTSETGEDVLELDAFVVEASVVDEMMASLELRMESDQLLNIMSAEDLSKYAASDVADALKRVAGVNIVEGQFAIIRGLEDRYSSTTYNGAPIPSPDPDRQSVQLDLFPSDVVGNLVVAKSFGPDLPGNSAGGSIDILTAEYPEEGFEFSLTGGAGWNDNSRQRYLAYDPFNPLGEDSDDYTEYEYGFTFGGRTQLLGREVRLKGVFNDELDIETLRGYQEDRQPDRSSSRRGTVLESGDLSLGILSWSGGVYDYTQSEETEQLTGFFTGGVDLDPEGDHKLDASFFYTDKTDRVSAVFENGFFPNVDYGPLLAQAQATSYQAIDPGTDLREEAIKSSPLAGSRTERGPETGHAFYTIFETAENFERERDLTVFQLNGDHHFGFLDGLGFSWAGNYAFTNQKQASFATEYFFEPDDPQAQIPDARPISAEEIGPGQWAVNESQEYDYNQIEEDQWFGRADLEYERALSEVFGFTLTGGGWYEDAERDVDAGFLTGPLGGSGTNVLFLDDAPRAVTDQVFEGLALGAPNSVSVFETVTNNSVRLIQALHAGLKLSFWERLDLVGGMRLEDIHIESNNDPFRDTPLSDGSPNIFPSRWVLFDRYDNPSLGLESSAPTPGSPEAIAKIHNDQILGLDVPLGPNGLVDFTTEEALLPFINGEIDEQYYLPALGASLRVPYLEGLTLRGAYSQTVARPSFREMGYYVTTEPGTNDRIIGNPQLDLSEVESWDVRAEYVFGDLGDLVAGSFFIKTIEDPIEAIIVTDQANFTTGAAGNLQTFFNNPSEADLLGFEVETRLHLGLFGLLGPFSDFMDNFSIGGNYTWIDAEVDRSPFEGGRTVSYFGVVEGDPEPISGYESSRRLFNQPEWIANADISFDHPELGTRITLAWFAISDVLDTVGGAALGPGNDVLEYTLDRYRDSFYQLDLVMSQDFSLPGDWGTVTFKSSIKNLTDSRRKIIYDRAQLFGGDVAERAYRVGRDYSFSLRFQYDF